MATVYVKSTRDFFPDFCDDVFSGISAFNGSSFSILSKNIVNNPLIWSNQINGYSNPGWADAIRAGLSATSNMTGSKTSIKANKMYAKVRTHDNTGVPGNYSMTERRGYPLYGIPNLDPPAAALIADVRNAAIAKFLSHVAEDRNNSQYGETLGEWKETVKAVTRPLSALRDFIIRWQRASRKRLKRFKRRGRGTARANRRFRTNRRIAEAEAKAVAGTYLEFVFGWIPLVKSTNEAVNRMLDRWDRPDRKITSGKAGGDYNGSDSRSNLFTHNYIRVSQGVKTHSHLDHRIRACLKTGAVNGNISVAQTLGLLPRDFVPTLYELFPFSFVLDYFLQVGDLINAMSFRRDSIIWGTSTLRTFTRREYSVPTWRIDPSLGVLPYILIDDVEIWGGDATIEVETVSRQDIFQVNLLPDLFWHLPWNPKAWANLAGIFTSNFARGI